MRAFVGVPLNPETRRLVGALQGELNRLHVPVSFTPPQNLHLTLHFLGEITPAQSIQIGTALAELTQTHRPFEILFQGTGAFPSLKVARVLWVGVERGQEYLKVLSDDVKEICKKAGILGDSKPFQPHLTIGRTVETRPGPLSLADRYLTRRIGTMQVDRFCLYKSELSPAGAKYTELAQIRLGSTSQ